MTREIEVDQLLALSRKELYQKLASESVEPEAIISLEAAFRGRFATLAEVLQEFSHYVSETLVAAFWESKSRLRKKPECLAQAILASFLKGRLPGDWRISLEQMAGVGRIDVFASLGEIRYVIEVKVLKNKSSSSATTRAVRQLVQYLKAHSVEEGFLIIFSTSDAERSQVKTIHKVDDKVIHLIIVDIRYVIPSSAK